MSEIYSRERAKRNHSTIIPLQRPMQSEYTAITIDRQFLEVKGQRDR